MQSPELTKQGENIQPKPTTPCHLMNKSSRYSFPHLILVLSVGVGHPLPFLQIVAFAINEDPLLGMHFSPHYNTQAGLNLILSSSSNTVFHRVIGPMPLSQCLTRNKFKCTRKTARFLRRVGLFGEFFSFVRSYHGHPSVWFFLLDSISSVIFFLYILIRLYINGIKMY